MAFSPDGQSLIRGFRHNSISQSRIPDTHGEISQGSQTQIEVIENRAQAIGPSWNYRWAEHAQKGESVTGIETDPAGRYVIIATANRVRVGAKSDEGFRFDREGPMFETRLRIKSMTTTPNGDYVAIATEEGAQILTVPSLQLIADLQPLSFASSRESKLSFNSDGTLLAWSDDGKMELRDTSFLSQASFETDEQQWAGEESQAINNMQSLRVLIDSDAFDIQSLAEGLIEEKNTDKFEMFEDQAGYMLEFANDDNAIFFSLQPPAGNLIAAGADRTSSPKVSRTLIDLYRASQSEHVMRFVLPEELPILRSLFFNESGTKFFVRAENANGNLAVSYSWPTLLPDLTVYISPATCQAPVNLPAGSFLATPGVLACDPV
jgi:hypothetical protein